MIRPACVDRVSGDFHFPRCDKNALSAKLQAVFRGGDFGHLIIGRLEPGLHRQTHQKKNNEEYVTCMELQATI